MVFVENLYKLFGSSQPLPQPELKRRYRDLSKLLHPDKFQDPTVEHVANTFSTLTSAYNLLRDKKFKSLYDKLLLSQQDSIELINPVESSIISLIDCDSTDIDLKIKFAFYGLSKDFDTDKYKIIVKYFLRLSPGSALNLIKKVAEKLSNNFFDFYFEVLYEILLNHMNYFSKYITFFDTLSLSDNQVEVLDFCKTYSNNDEGTFRKKDLFENCNYKLIHLIEIKKIEKSELNK